MNFQFFFTLHLVAACMMTGLIWLVQLVHYPAFQFIDKHSFSQFHKFHSQKITLIVAPVMMIELATAIALSLQDSLFFKVNLLAVVLIWGATAFISVPIHNRLSNTYDLEQVKKLVQTNWIRTLLWTLKMLGLTTWLLNS